MQHRFDQRAPDRPPIWRAAVDQLAQAVGHDGMSKLVEVHNAWSATGVVDQFLSRVRRSGNLCHQSPSRGERALVLRNAGRQAAVSRSLCEQIEVREASYLGKSFGETYE
jgi:hypothetical protein